MHSGLRLAVIDSIIVALCCMNQGWTAGGYCVSFSADASAYGPIDALAAFACDGSWYLPGLRTNGEAFACRLVY
jgi:hypothetical protein